MTKKARLGPIYSCIAKVQAGWDVEVHHREEKSNHHSVLSVIFFGSIALLGFALI